MRCSNCGATRAMGCGRCGAGPALHHHGPPVRDRPTAHRKPGARRGSKTPSGASRLVGGRLCPAAFGASLFRQAVLLFRAPTTTRQVPPEEFVPVPGSRYRDRNSGTAPTTTGRPSDPIPSSQQRAQAVSRTSEARRPAAREQRASSDAAEHAALCAPSTTFSTTGSRRRTVRFLERFMGCESQKIWSPTPTSLARSLPREIPDRGCPATEVTSAHTDAPRSLKMQRSATDLAS